MTNLLTQLSAARFLTPTIVTPLARAVLSPPGASGVPLPPPRPLPRPRTARRRRSSRTATMPRTRRRTGAPTLGHAAPGHTRRASRSRPRRRTLSSVSAACSSLARPGTCVASLARPGTCVASLARPGTCVASLARPGTCVACHARATGARGFGQIAQVVGEQLQRLRSQAVAGIDAFDRALHEPCLLQHLEMLGNGGLRQGQHVDQLAANTVRAIGQHARNPIPGRIAERTQHGNDPAFPLRGG